MLGDEQDLSGMTNKHPKFLSLDINKLKFSAHDFNSMESLCLCVRCLINQTNEDDPRVRMSAIIYKVIIIDLTYNW